MKIRNKILIYFSSVVISLTAVTFSIVYYIFSENREEEFQQRQKDKILTTLYFLSEIKETDEELIEALDQLTINDLFDEKLLLFNDKKELIYSSVDDTPVAVSKELLSKLNSNKRWIETKEGLYDVVGTYIDKNGSTYFGISKAYDTFGYNKMYFLRNTLFIAFMAIALTVLLISFFLARRISKPLTDLAELLSSYRLGELQLSEKVKTTTFEIIYLNDKFDELVKRVHETFDFQKHSIHHISHQLKTPITILISELERIKNASTNGELQSELKTQIIKTKSLGDIINVLLEISKVEAGQAIVKEPTRIDELIFDCIEELNTVYPDFNFEVNYIPQEPNANNLVLSINEMLMKQAIQNLLNNAVAYGDDSKVEIKIDCSRANELLISITNSGKVVKKEETKYLFTYFFRGENSRNKTGFGLGLVFTKKIINLNAGDIQYSSPSANLNVFEIKFSLS